MEEDLQNLMASNIVKYKGCLIHITPEGYVTGKKPFATLREAMKDIDNTFLTWSKSLNKNGNP